MPKQIVLPDHQKMTITCRIEAGCLGPKGALILEQFCKVAQAEFDQIHTGFVKWIILPRLDKSLPEIEYQVNSKKMTREQADQYLKAFDETADKFEDYIAEVVAFSVNVFLIDHTG